jgi:hypothetical protein
LPAKDELPAARDSSLHSSLRRKRSLLLHMIVPALPRTICTQRRTLRSSHMGARG